MVSSDPLGREIVLKHMKEALPAHEDDDSSSDLTSCYEVIALLCHACMVATNYSLIGCGSNKESVTELKKLSPRLPKEWNSGLFIYIFKYSHPNSEIACEVHIKKIGPKALITGISRCSSRKFMIETLPVGAYVATKLLPLRLAMFPKDIQDQDGEDTIIGCLFKDRGLENLVDEFRRTIVTGLASVAAEAANWQPNKEPTTTEDTHTRIESSEVTRRKIERSSELSSSRWGSWRDRPAPDALPQLNEDPVRSRAQAQGSREILDRDIQDPVRPPPFDGTLHPVPRRPIPAGDAGDFLIPAGDFPPPGFEDEHQMLNRPRVYSPQPSRPPFNIGHDDLNPPGLGPHDPLRPSFIGGQTPGGGGMHPTFDDPLFRGDHPSRGYDPRVPPGARYDPTGPGDVERSSSGRPRFAMNPLQDRRPTGDRGGLSGPPFGTDDDLMIPRPSQASRFGANPLANPFAPREPGDRVGPYTDSDNFFARPGPSGLPGPSRGGRSRSRWVDRFGGGDII